MDDDVRKVEQWTILHEINIGGTEIVLGEAPTDTEQPYMVAYCTSKMGGLLLEYTGVVPGKDYLELMSVFLDRCKEQLTLERTKRAEIDIPFSLILPEHCIPDSYKDCIEGKVVAHRGAEDKRIAHPYHRIPRSAHTVPGTRNTRPGRHLLWQKCHFSKYDFLQ